jgi:hypothetical protein
LKCGLFNFSRAGALAGTSFPLDRELTTKLLGFQEVHPHGLDATSSRDFMLDILYACSSVQVTMSRLAEELIFWGSHEFRTVTLDDGYAMGSSMMPQKKNPGSLELLRGRSGRIFGLLQAGTSLSGFDFLLFEFNFVFFVLFVWVCVLFVFCLIHFYPYLHAESLGLVLMKGLPSGYNRDFHEDKEILVEVLDLMHKALPIIPALVESTTLNYERMEELTYGAFCTATEGRPCCCRWWWWWWCFFFLLLLLLLLSLLSLLSSSLLLLLLLLLLFLLRNFLISSGELSCVAAQRSIPPGPPHCRLACRRPITCRQELQGLGDVPEPHHRDTQSASRPREAEECVQLEGGDALIQLAGRHRSEGGPEDDGRLRGGVGAPQEGENLLLFVSFLFLVFVFLLFPYFSRAGC